MARHGQSVVEANREIRQEALREQLKAGGHLQQVVENIEQIRTLKKNELWKLPKLKTSAELQLRLVNKYLPDLKLVEHSGEDGGPIKHQHDIAVPVVLEERKFIDNLEDVVEG